MSTSDKLIAFGEIGVKLGAIVAGLCLGFFGRDWQSGAVVMATGLGVSSVISKTAQTIQAIKAG